MKTNSTIACIVLPTPNQNFQTDQISQFFTRLLIITCLTLCFLQKTNAQIEFESITYNDFNSSPAASSTTLWLNVHTKLSGDLANDGDYLKFTAGYISLHSINASWRNAEVPDGIIMASNSVISPVSSFNSLTNTWITLVPLGYTTSDIFISGGSVISSTGYSVSPGKHSKLDGMFQSNIDNFSSSWFYGVSCYNPAFNNGAVSAPDVVNAIATSGKKAGTPTNMMANLVAGGSGDGDGSNFTGSYSATHPFTATRFVILPVILTSLSGQINSNKVGLNWTIDNNETVGHFDVEKSLNGIDFNSIAIVFSKYVAGIVNYQHTDTLKSTGNIYYRLKMIDRNQVVQYSKVLILKAQSSSNSDGIKILGNPGSNQISLLFNSADNVEAQVRIFDCSGKILLKQKISVYPGNNQVSVNFPSSVARGIYTLSYNDGTNQSNQQFLKQ